MQDKSNSSFFIVQTIIGKKIVKNQIFYLIKWEKYPIEDSTWQPRYSLISTISKLIFEYENAIKGMKLPLICDEYLRMFSRKLDNSRQLKQNDQSFKKKQKMAKITQKSKAKLSKPKNSTSLQQSIQRWNQNEKTSIILEKSSSYEYDSLNGQITNFSIAKSVSDDDNMQQPISELTFKNKIQERSQKIFQIQEYIKPKVKSNEKKKSPFVSLTFSKEKDLGENQDSNGQLSNMNIFYTRSSNDKIRKIKYLKRVKGKIIFDMENLYQVTFHNDTIEQMTTNELKESYPNEFIRFLEMFVK